MLCSKCHESAEGLTDASREPGRARCHYTVIGIIPCRFRQLPVSVENQQKVVVVHTPYSFIR